MMNLTRKLPGSATSALPGTRAVRGIHGGHAKGLQRSSWMRVTWTDSRYRHSISRASSENHECSSASWSGTPESSSDKDLALEDSSPESSYDEQRRRWAAGVRSKTGRRKHRVWEPQVLDPPPLLSDIKVVMVRTKRPVTIGTVARACSSFELENICMVAPDCDPMQRSGRNASCGAQYLLHRLEYCDTVEEAVADCSCSVAFTRWLPGQKQQSVRSMADLVSALDAKGTSGKIALVFGREDTGLYDEEIAACDMVCSIPIGRLQESLSVSHAVTIPLSQIFESRLEALGDDGADPWLCSAGEDEIKMECTEDE